MLRDDPQTKSQSAPNGHSDAAGQLRALGWSDYFADQATSAALSQTPPVRITQVHRNTLHIQGVDLNTIIPGLQWRHRWGLAPL